MSKPHTEWKHLDDIEVPKSAAKTYWVEMSRQEAFEASIVLGARIARYLEEHPIGRERLWKRDLVAMRRLQIKLDKIARL